MCAASIAQWQSTALVKQGSRVRISLEASFYLQLERDSVNNERQPRPEDLVVIFIYLFIPRGWKIPQLRKNVGEKLAWAQENEFCFCKIRICAIYEI